MKKLPTNTSWMNSLPENLKIEMCCVLNEMTRMHEEKPHALRGAVERYLNFC